MNEKIISCLPESIRNLINERKVPDEIRLRKNKNTVLIYGDKKIITDYALSEAEFELSIQNLSRKSMHSYSEFITKGFIPFENGSRIGIAGSAVCEDGKISNIKNISSLNIRLVNNKPNIQGDIPYSKIIIGGLLVFSPPNYGKTTLLRYLASTLSLPPYNKTVCICDTRGEISGNENFEFNGDVLKYYPKNNSLDIALRCMSPEIIVCDEIGLDENTETLCECAISGITLICSAHAENLCSLLKRKNIETLHKNNIFGGYMEISLNNCQRVYTYIPRESVKC